jgi:hypothetical protein
MTECVPARSASTGSDSAVQRATADALFAADPTRHHELRPPVPGSLRRQVRCFAATGAQDRAPGDEAGIRDGCSLGHRRMAPGGPFNRRHCRPFCQLGRRHVAGDTQKLLEAGDAVARTSASRVRFAKLDALREGCGPPTPCRYISYRPRGAAAPRCCGRASGFSRPEEARDPFGFALAVFTNSELEG